MAIIFTRVDNRLIHGQVVEGWLPVLKAQEVIVISADAPKSSLMQKMLRMSLPQNYSLKIFSPQEGAPYLKEPSVQKQFVLLESVKDLKEILDSGIKLDCVNIGNVQYEEGKEDYGGGIFLSGTEASILKGISDSGIKIDIRALPSSMSGGRFFK